jgi:hypothetical protein
MKRGHGDEGWHRASVVTQRRQVNVGIVFIGGSGDADRRVQDTPDIVLVTSNVGAPGETHATSERYGPCFARSRTNYLNVYVKHLRGILPTMAHHAGAISAKTLY